MKIMKVILSDHLWLWSDTMTVKELKELLSNYPENSIVMYRHNKYGRIDIDTINYKEEILLTGNCIKTVTLEASFEED